MFKSSCLVLILCLIHPITEACECVIRPIAQEIESADQIFTGRVTGRTELRGKVSYQFEVSRNWKGAEIPTISLTTGMGGGDCGMIFEMDKEYVVFTSKGQTSRCRPNESVNNGMKIGLLRYHLDDEFRNQIATDSRTKLNAAEALYFNSLLKTQRGSFDFADKHVAFYTNNSLTDKQRYFKSNGGRTSAEQLMILTKVEKQATGYEAVIVSWKKTGLGKGFRKRVIKELRASRTAEYAETL